MEKKMNVVLWLDKNGYYFGTETLEHFANRFEYDVLVMFAQCFAKYNNIIFTI